MPQLHLVRTSAAAALALLAVTGCGSDDDRVASAPEPVVSAPTPTPAASVAPSTPPSSPVATAGPSNAAPAADQTFEITAAGGQVTGDTGRLEVAVGEAVAVRVTSDTADEVHLHGYDVSAPVAPGQPAELLFEATIPGVFEIELENSGVALARLQVS